MLNVIALSISFNMFLVDLGDPSKSRGVPKTTQQIEYGGFLVSKSDWKA